MLQCPDRTAFALAGLMPSCLGTALQHIHVFDFTLHITFFSVGGQFSISWWHSAYCMLTRAICFHLCLSHKPCLIRSCKICGKGVPMVFSLSMQARLFDNVTWECYGEFKPRVYTTSKHWQCSVQASIGTCQKLISHVEKIYSGPCGIPQWCCFPYRMRLKGFHLLR